MFEENGNILEIYPNAQMLYKEEFQKDNILFFWKIPSDMGNITTNIPEGNKQMNLQIYPQNLYLITKNCQDPKNEQKNFPSFKFLEQYGSIFSVSRQGQGIDKSFGLFKFSFQKK